MISKRTWILGAATLFFLALVLYCRWRMGWGPSWLPRVHAQDVGVADVFTPNPCDMWRQMPLLDKVVALGLFSSSVAFFMSLALDLWRYVRASAVKSGR